MTTETIDFSRVYKIEAIPSKEHKELAEKGISKYPGTMQLVTAKWNDMLKKFDNTGFDEFAPEILKLPSEKREEAQKKVIAKREELEAIIGQQGYLKPISDAWMSEVCMVQIEVGQDLQIKVNGRLNELRPAESYKDAIALSLLMNSDTFPKSKQEIGKPQYKNARFYLTTDEEITDFNQKKIRKTRQANVKMAELFEDSKDKGKRAWEIAFKLGLVNKQKVDAELLEMKLHEAVFNDKTGKTMEAFLEACEMDNATLAIHNLFKTGINLGIIRVTPDGFYHKGVDNYRKSIPESIEYLMLPGNELKLGELRSEVEGRKKKHNAIG